MKHLKFGSKALTAFNLNYMLKVIVVGLILIGGFDLFGGWNKTRHLNWERNNPSFQSSFPNLESKIEESNTNLIKEAISKYRENKIENDNDFEYLIPSETFISKRRFYDNFFGIKIAKY